MKTPCFTMRPLREGDEIALFPTFADEAQCRYLTRPAFASEWELRDWLFAPDWPGLTWIAEDERKQVMGRFIAVPAHEAGVFEIGYVTCIQAQRQGVARECGLALVRHLFEDRSARKLISEVDADNVASIRLVEALGFTREALLREHETTHIGLRDAALYGLLASDRARPGSRRLI